MGKASIVWRRMAPAWACIRCKSAWRLAVGRWRSRAGRARARRLSRFAPSLCSTRRRARRAAAERGVSAMAERISVLIVDDHDVVRQGIRAFLASQPDLEVVGEAASGAEAVRLAQEYIPDVVLMDLVMPGMTGVEATRAVKRISPRTQVVVLTSYHEDEHIFPALRAGALSYTLKDIRSSELAGIIRQAAQGESVLHPRVATRVIRSEER